MESEESAPSLLKSSNKQSAAHAAGKPRATEHTLCVRCLAWPSGLVFGIEAAELARVTGSFKGLFILVLISKEYKSD
jgi:hypothetical protein